MAADLLTAVFLHPLQQQVVDGREVVVAAALERLQQVGKANGIRLSSNMLSLDTYCLKLSTIPLTTPPPAATHTHAREKAKPDLVRWNCENNST